MGNSASANPIRNIDKRTARREYKENFTRAILNYQLENNIDPSVPTHHSEQRVLNFDDESGSNVRVLVRKRPIFEHEIAGHEFDVATCLDKKNIAIHDARMHADMRRMLMTHHNFAFDGVFNEWASNDDVYASAAHPLVREAVRGGFATACVYGQTGSGKSFTMTSFYEKAAFDIFKELDEHYGRFDKAPRVSISFFELQGDTCLDLLNCFQSTQLLTATDGGVHAIPCVEPTVHDADEMVELIRHALSIRTTAATGVHDSSSRSHAILRIFIEQPAAAAGPSAAGTFGNEEGVLTLVDLAGSEQSIDSMYHTAERRKEGAAINSSLMALKDCIRAKAAGKAPTHIFRKSKLTMALKQSFILPGARTVVVATVSPSSKDTEHSLNTLRHACMMDGQENDQQAAGESRFVTGGVKSRTVEIGQVNVTEIARKNKALKAQGKTVEDKTSNGNSFGSQVNKKDKNSTDKEKARARRLADRQGIARLTEPVKKMLMEHREALGCEQQQLDRMRRAPPPTTAVGDSHDSSVERNSLPEKHDEYLGLNNEYSVPEPMYKITNTNDRSCENSPRSSYEFSPRGSRDNFSPRAQGPSGGVHTKSTVATAESRRKAQDLVEARKQQKLKLKQELEALEREEEAERQGYSHPHIEVDVTKQSHRADGRYEEHKSSPYRPLPDGGLVEGSFNKKTLMANYDESPPRHSQEQQPQRKSHMSSYGGSSSSNGARTAVVHNTVQARETRPVDMNVAKTRSNAPPQQISSKQAKEDALAEAMRKVEDERALKEMRRERARAVMRAKDGEGREAARTANRASASQQGLTVATEVVDHEAQLRAMRREKAHAVRDAKEEEKKQSALKRLHNKGFSMSRGSASGAALPSSGPTVADEDFDIKRLEKQLIASRYQPEAKQYGIKKQLATLKAAKMRRERGDTDGRVIAASANRPSSSGATRPSSAGDKNFIDDSHPRGSSSARGGRQIANYSAAAYEREDNHPEPKYLDSPPAKVVVSSSSRIPVQQAPSPSRYGARAGGGGANVRLGAAAAPWGNAYNS
jgi:kinesin family protein 2/24